MAKLVKSEVEAAISKGIKDMDSLYRKLYRKGKDAKVPTTFAPAVCALMGSDPFAPKVEAKPKKERKPRQPKAEKPPKPPKTTPYRIGTDYQAIVEFALNGGGNGMSIGNFRKALVEKGICADEVKAHASLNVVRNPEQFSNRGKTRCVNYVKGIERNAEGKLTENALAFRKTADYGTVCIEVLSLTPTKADRYGKPPKAAAPAPAPQEQNVTSADSPAAPVESPVEASVEAKASEVPAPQDAPAPVEGETVPEIPAT